MVLVTFQLASAILLYWITIVLLDVFFASLLDAAHEKSSPSQSFGFCLFARTEKVEQDLFVTRLTGDEGILNKRRRLSTKTRKKYPGTRLAANSFYNAPGSCQWPGPSKMKTYHARDVPGTQLLTLIKTYNNNIWELSQIILLWGWRGNFGPVVLQEVFI